MTIYDVFTLALRLIVVTTLFWPLTIPLAALAYKVRLGQQPIPMEPGPFWIRSTFASLGLAVLSGVMVGLYFLLVRLMELPAGPVEVVLLLAYIPAAVWYLFWMFALDDMIEALGIFLIYVLLPGLPLLLLAWVTGLWKRMV
ncbi:MAG TPA: hypothetical protein VNK04_18130 [Gemmataceae bacterium]|nr:hypothetical protein [Gemmataceae bacterium]